jgi:flagellar hook-associated protein 2
MAVDYLSALNVGSGLNVTQIVDSLVEAEKAPRQEKIEAALEKSSVSISALGSLKNELNTMSANIGQLVGQEGLLVTSGSTALEITRTGNGQVAEFSSSIQINQLATAQVIEFDGFTSTTDDINVDTITVDIGTWSAGPSFSSNANYSQQSLSFTAGNRSLTDVRDAINNLDIGLSANIVQTSSGQYSLSVKSLIGENKELKLTSSISGVSNSFFKYDPSNVTVTDNGIETVNGGNALLDLDGIAIERDTNEISDLLNGVKLQLNGTTSSSFNVSAQYDSGAAEATLTNLVNEFNFLINFIDEQTQNTSSSADTGPLHGDIYVRSLENKIRSFTTSPIAGYDTDPVYLSNFGVMTNRDGTLSINQTQFKKYFSEKPEHFAAITSTMVRTSDVSVIGTMAGDNYVAGKYDLQIAAGSATIDGETMTSGNNAFTIVDTNSDLVGLVLRTEKTNLNASVYVGRSLIDQMSSYITSVLKINGDIDTRVSNLNKDKTKYETDLENLEEAMKKQREIYVEKFTQMEKTVATFKETGKFLDNLMESWKASL